MSAPYLTTAEDHASDVVSGLMDQLEALLLKENNGNVAAWQMAEQKANEIAFTIRETVKHMQARELAPQQAPVPKLNPIFADICMGLAQRSLA